MQTTEASVIFSMMLVGGVIVSFVWGYISDRGKKKSILIFILVCSSVLFYSLSFIKVPLILALVLFFIGFMSQAVVVQTILADVANPTYLDEIFGFCQSVGLPTTFDEMGMKSVTDEILNQVADEASKDFMIMSMPKASRKNIGSSIILL